MSWSVFYLPETEKDFQQLSRQQILRVMKAIEKKKKKKMMESVWFTALSEQNLKCLW